jgi:hypothetical protein
MRRPHFDRLGARPRTIDPMKSTRRDNWGSKHVRDLAPPDGISR